eukprot:82347-Prymnesium_polylepis.1
MAAHIHVCAVLLWAIRAPGMRARTTRAPWSPTCESRPPIVRSFPLAPRAKPASRAVSFRPRCTRTLLDRAAKKPQPTCTASWT